jgi:hypothetical protein
LNARTVGGKNVRLRIRKGNRTYTAFGFNMASRIDELRSPIDILFHPRILKTARGEEVELLLRDFAAKS